MSCSPSKRSFSGGIGFVSIGAATVSDGTSKGGFGGTFGSNGSVGWGDFSFVDSSFFSFFFVFCF